MTRFLSVKNFCTRTATKATMIAVNIPPEPRLSIEKVKSSSLSEIIKKITVAIEALTMASCFSRLPKS